MPAFKVVTSLRSPMVTVTFWYGCLIVYGSRSDAVPTSTPSMSTRASGGAFGVGAGLFRRSDLLAFRARCGGSGAGGHHRGADFDADDPERRRSRQHQHRAPAVLQQPLAPADTLDPPFRLRILRIERQRPPECSQRRTGPALSQLLLADGEAARDDAVADFRAVPGRILDELGQIAQRLVEARLAQELLELELDLGRRLVP